MREEIIAGIMANDSVMLINVTVRLQVELVLVVVLFKDEQILSISLQ